MRPDKEYWIQLRAEDICLEQYGRPFALAGPHFQAAALTLADAEYAEQQVANREHQEDMKHDR